MPEQIIKERGARLVVSFELADVKKVEGLYIPELTIGELLVAIEEYTHSACSRTRGYDAEISNPFLSAVDFAVANAARNAVSALFVELEAEKKDLAMKNLELERRIDVLKGGGPPKTPLIVDIDDDIPF